MERHRQPPAPRPVDRRQWLAAAIGTAALASLTLAACNALPPRDLVPPKLRFSDFRIEEFGLSEISFLLAVDTENPNDVRIPLRNVDFALELLGEPFADGTVSGREVTLPAQGSLTLPVHFTVPTAQLMRVLRGLRDTSADEWRYRLTGSASWGWSGFPLRFERTGDLEVLREFRQWLSAPTAR